MKNTTSCILIFVLVSIDQFIKLIVHNFFLNSEFEIIPSILDFKPTFNHKYFYVNSLFDLCDGFWIHIIGCTIGILIMIGIGLYYKNRNESSIILSTGLVLSISGFISALICTVFWNGTLDYLYFKPHFVFDLKDVYLNSFLPCFIIYCIMKYKKHKRSSN